MEPGKVTLRYGDGINGVEIEDAELANRLKRIIEGVWNERQDK